MPPNFNRAAQNTTSDQEQLKSWLALILESTFSDRGHCLIALPPEAKPLFEEWNDNYLFPSIAKDPTYDDYSGYSDLTEGYFGIRVKDTPQIIDRILSEMGIQQHGITYFIMHDPKSGKTLKNNKPEQIQGPTNAP